MKARLLVAALAVAAAVVLSACDSGTNASGNIDGSSTMWEPPQLADSSALAGPPPASMPQVVVHPVNPGTHVDGVADGGRPSELDGAGIMYDCANGYTGLQLLFDEADSFGSATYSLYSNVDRSRAIDLASHNQLNMQVYQTGTSKYKPVALIVDSSYLSMGDGNYVIQDERVVPLTSVDFTTHVLVLPTSDYTDIGYITNATLCVQPTS
ncbi:MAG TPA: hypothetical protein VLE99_06125 [Candidatus Saccharimonadales bacterium]|nr:hypothetical protein [Candidatus Saccharimonadales bacterium]